jgi:hypothetical protein
MELWMRTVQEEYGTVQQFIRLNSITGEAHGWEVYEDGHKSDEVELDGDTIPAGFERAVLEHGSAN